MSKKKVKEPSTMYGFTVHDRVRDTLRDRTATVTGFANSGCVVRYDDNQAHAIVFEDYLELIRRPRRRLTP